MTTDTQTRIAKLRTRTPVLEPLNEEDFNEAVGWIHAGSVGSIAEDVDHHWLITYGHVDKDSFAAAANNFDKEVVPSPGTHTAERVWHAGAVVTQRGAGVPTLIRLATSVDPLECVFPVTGVFRCAVGIS